MASLHEIIRAKLIAGALSARHLDDQVWYGRGTLLPCDACDGIIAPGDVQVDVLLEDGRGVRLHGACFHIWASLIRER